MKKKERKPSKILVLSDTHFGDRLQLLDDRRLMDRLAEALGNRGEISELVLLGDIIDLWVETMVPALKQARCFVERLSLLENVRRVIYIPGNHDHQMFMDAFRMERDMRIMQGDLGVPRFSPSRSYGTTVLQSLAAEKSEVEFSMVYPFIIREVGTARVLLTHGHHLDFYSDSQPWARSFWLGRYIIKKRKKLATLHDIEMANIPFCGTMSVMPYVPELVEDGLRYYRLINFFARLFDSEEPTSPLRDSLIKDNYDEIEGLLRLLGHPDPDCFVFGHTHRPGIGRLPGTETVVANSGSWVEVDDEDCPSMTWVEIDSSVMLFTLDDDGPRMIDSAALAGAEQEVR